MEKDELDSFIKKKKDAIFPTVLDTSKIEKIIPKHKSDIKPTHSAETIGVNSSRNKHKDKDVTGPRNRKGGLLG